MDKFLYQHRNEIIGSVLNSLDKFNYETFEREVKALIYNYLDEHNQNYFDEASDNAIDEFYQFNYLILRDNIKAKEEAFKRNQQESRIRNARDSLFATIARASKPKTIGEARRLKYFRALMDIDQEKVYREYLDEYKRTHKELHETVAHKETFSDKIKKFVIEHPDEYFEYDKFLKVIKDWPKGLYSNEKCYEIYKNLFYKQPENNIQIEQTPISGTIGFKSPNKVKALLEINSRMKTIDEPKSSFPLKDNTKKYQLHKMSSRDSYIIDLMMVYHLCYLVAININTRYLYVKLTNIELGENKFSKRDKKSSKRYLNALRALIDQGMVVRYLSGDGESAFNSAEAQEFYINNGITFRTVPRQVNGAYPDFMKSEQRLANKTSPLHSSLGIIDRVIRTLRDMAYNMKIGMITPNVMEDLVFQYNHAPHQTLSKYAGYPVSPQQVQNDHELENYIVRRICQENYNIKNSPGFKIEEGMNVKVYNETDKMLKRRSIIQPGEHKIIGFENGLYLVKSGKNIQKLPRYRLAHMWE